MNEKLKNLLKKLGVSDATITKYSTTDETAVAALDPEKDAVTLLDGLKNVLKNDAVFVDGIKSGQRAETLSSKENKFRKMFDLSSEDVSGLPEKLARRDRPCSI